MTEKLDKKRLRYQSVVLDGEATQGHDRSYLNDVIFGDDAKGRSFLDVGSYLGFFCLEAMKRGAANATGIEPDAESIAQARAIAKEMGVNPTYLHGDFEEWDFGDQKFDVVLCLNVLHHMFDAVGAINKLKGLAKRKVVIEFAAPAWRDLFGRSMNPFALLANALPAIVLGDPRKNVDVAARSYLITAKAMRVLFDKHTCAFEPVLLRKSPFKGRWILEANRRDIGHVAFIAGPTSSGKSTLFNNLASQPSTRREFGLGTEAWATVHGHDINLPRGRNERVLVHYDLFRPYKRSIRSHSRDPRCDLFKVADGISVITLVVAPSRLRQQLLTAAGVANPEKLGKRHRDLYEQYASLAFMTTWYGSWFNYLDSMKAKMSTNSILFRDDAGKETKVDAQQWLALISSLYEN